MGISTDNNITGRIGVPSTIKGSNATISGADGNGIDRIEKTSSVGLIDTYTIYFTDGNTTTFEVHNGAKGDTGKGIASVEFNQDYTLTITFTDNTTYTTDSIRGEKGERGEQGVQGPQGRQGEQGEQGIQGVSVASVEQIKSSIEDDGKNTLRITLSNGVVSTFDIYNGSKGDKGDKGEQGEQGIQGIQGVQGVPGKDFSISQTYSSIAEMKADKDNVEIGSFVIISSTVEDEDNAKLYVRNNSQDGFGFVADLSGTQGMKGDKGEQGIQGPQGEQGVGILSIMKTATEGLVDTYTITLTNGNTSIFTVTNADVGSAYTREQTDQLLDNKVNKVSGKDLSTNDFTDELETKLNGIETDAQENKIEGVKANGILQTIVNKIIDIFIPTKTSDLTNDSNFIDSSDSRLTNSRTPTSHASSSTTYGVGTTTSYGHCKTINNLTTSSHTNGYALSAYQGYLLNQNKVDKGSETITGVKGSSESTYRTGNVNITKANIGLGNVENKSSETIRGEITKSNITNALGYDLDNYEVVVSPTEPTTDKKKVWLQSGKNKFDQQTYIKNPTLGATVDNVLIKLKPNTSYTMSSNVPTSNGATLLFFGSGTSTNGFTTSNNGVWNGQTRTFTSDSNGYVCIAYRRLENDTNIDLTNYWYQIEQGSTATEYEAYVEPKIYVKNDNDVYEELEIEKNKFRYSANGYTGSALTIGNTLTNIYSNIPIETNGGDLLITVSLPLSVSTQYTGTVFVYIDGERVGNRIITARGTSVLNYTGQNIVSGISKGSHTLDIKGAADGNYNLIVNQTMTTSLSIIEL